MLEEIIGNSDLKKYLTTFNTGEMMLVEGDDSQDLYILVSGELDVLKGNKKMWEIAEPGSIFGEMSFLSGGLGRIRSTDVLPLLLAHAERLMKYGA